MILEVLDWCNGWRQRRRSFKLIIHILVSEQIARVVPTSKHSTVVLRENSYTSDDMLYFHGGHYCLICPLDTET
jgi:hypothetical protein